MSSKKITSQSKDFSEWYIDVIKRAELMDYTPVRGCIVFKPASYAIWESIQKELDARFKETGHENAYFPLLIPESFFQKEKEHVEGFSPELPWVTEVAGEKLEEKLAIRPTSETMIGYMYSQWIQSYRDLPILLNQWANIVRWEKRTLPFIRTSEILWQEGHTAHATEEEAREETMQMLNVYTEFIENVLAIPVIQGQKTPSEKFAGAVDTYSVELMMKDGKALQAGTSHYMGQNFAKGFDIQFTNKENKLEYVYTTSWGVTTRLIGAMIMVHGDDKGLIVPPKLAPIQVMVIPIGKNQDREDVLQFCEQLKEELIAEGVRLKVDSRENHSPGWKFNEYELKGIPIRLEVGPRDLKEGQVILARRDTSEKITVPVSEVKKKVQHLMVDIQENLFEKAKEFYKENSFTATTLEELIQIIQEKRGFVLAGWCGELACEKKVQDACGATSRNIPFSSPSKMEKCLTCGEKAVHTVWFAKAY